MKPINWGRMILGGLVAGILMFIGDGIVHGALMGLHDDIPLLCIAACRYRIRQRSSSCRRRHA